MEQDLITLTDPDISTHELAAVANVLKSSRLSAGPVVENFEAAFALSLGRRYGIAVASGTIGLMVSLRALGIGPATRLSPVLTPGTRLPTPLRWWGPRRFLPILITGLAPWR